ncbi:hypothetical protein [Hymenobacter psychrotolerans]|uniref:hypothetical protein n=1 Tax=Hymenobacter psychrotolerans TaxID=344998 RepID=UPI000933473F|nr:hypothetical protein [Hymenobacter psychrotolerans]
MFAVVCRLFLALVFVVAGTLASFTATAAPILRLSIFRSTPKYKVGQLHHPNYRSYKTYRQF